MASTERDDLLREEIATLLANGVDAEVWPRASSSEEVNAIVHRLRTEATDLKSRLKVAGFTDHVISADEIEQPCETCMYYLVKRKFCELPELMVPVEPDWSCRLWRI